MNEFRSVFVLDAEDAEFFLDRIIEDVHYLRSKLVPIVCQIPKTPTLRQCPEVRAKLDGIDEEMKAVMQSEDDHDTKRQKFRELHSKQLKAAFGL